MGGGKNRNKKVQPYAVFVSEEAKRLGISTQEAFDRCGDTWKNMTDDERQRYVTLMRNFNTSTYYMLFFSALCGYPSILKMPEIEFFGLSF